MEYYGKILCISAKDLTYDDRPKIVNGKQDYSNSRALNGVHPSMLSEEVLAPIMSEANYKKLVIRKQINVVRPGKGLGHYALVEVATLPIRFKERIKEKYGDMSSCILQNWFASHYEIDVKAREYFSRFRFPDGTALPPEHINEYTNNASAIQSVLSVMADTKTMRQSMANGRINWGEMAGAIGFFQVEFGHTLPLSPTRFQKKVNEFKAEGYESLISKKFNNQNTRKVNHLIGKILLGLATLPNKPWNCDVREMYNLFVQGKLDVFDPETGELYDPSHFTDKKGNPIVLSQATINNFLNQPKNQILIDHKLMTWSTFMHEQRPHVHRHAGDFSFSKISFDDRDLPRKLKDTKLRPKAYYAYDVTSQCIVGVAYNRKKNVDLVVEMFRSMFRLIERKGWGMPAEVEVENHLMSQWKDGFLKAGVVFPFVRFCAPLNSQEKYAEPLNGAKKRSVEHKNHLDVGRFYAKNKKYRTEYKKISDELNDTYEDKQYYSWDELISEDMTDVLEFNNRLHPNQKKYPGMTRWQVLEDNMNPNLRPYDKALLSFHIGEHVKTSIKRNSYCRVDYTDWWISNPKVLEKLAPNNYEVDAYYIPEEDGSIKDVFIYQNGLLLDTLKDVGTFNTAAAERTDNDRLIMTEQNKRISKFDKMVKDDAIAPLAILKPEEKKVVEYAKVRPLIITPEQDSEDDFSEFMDISSYGQRAVAAL